MIPACATTVQFQIAGGGGAGPAGTTDTASNGGSGALIYGTITISWS